MKKLTRTAKILDTVLRILFWVMIAAGIIAAVGIVLSFALQASGKDVGSPIFGIDLDFITLELAEGVIPSQEIAKVQRNVNLIGILLLTVGMTLGAWCISLLRGILRPMKEAQPFHDAVSTGFKKLAWLELIGGAILSIAEVVMEHLIIYGFNLKELLVNDKISSITFHMNLDVNFVVTAAACFLLSYIFRYGAQLQQLSDETL
jgi:hypothetical protein